MDGDGSNDTGRDLNPRCAVVEKNVPDDSYLLHAIRDREGVNVHPPCVTVGDVPTYGQPNVSECTPGWRNPDLDSESCVVIDGIAQNIGDALGLFYDHSRGSTVVDRAGVDGQLLGFWRRRCE